MMRTFSFEAKFQANSTRLCKAFSLHGTLFLMQNNFSTSYTPKFGNVGNPDQEQAVSVATRALC